MPVYRYSCACGLKFDQFLTADKDSVVLNCDNCGRGVTAKQVRDKQAFVAENNDVKGILRHESK